jgi:hypothetical protein
MVGRSIQVGQLLMEFTNHENVGRAQSAAKGFLFSVLYVFAKVASLHLADGPDLFTFDEFLVFPETP